MSDSHSTSKSGLVGLSQAVRETLVVSRNRNERVFIVGGVVRDLLMSRSLGEHDLDIVVEGHGIAFARDLAERLECSVREHAPFLTAKLIAPFGLAQDDEPSLLDEVDVATSREESYERPGALPTVTAALIDKDLWRRDFSSNAIALPLEAYENFFNGRLAGADLPKHVIDPTGGCADIQNSTLKILHPKSFVDDPTRLFRAIRYIVRLGFHFDMATLAGFLEAVKSGVLATLSPRRVWNEVVAAFDEVAPSEIVQEFLQRGLFSALPVVTPADPGWVLESLERLEQLRKVIGQDNFRDAGKILLIAGLLREGREDIARALHEGNKVLHRASAVMEGDKVPGVLKNIPDVAAAYCVHCTRELQQSLQHLTRRTE